MDKETHLQSGFSTSVEKAGNVLERVDRVEDFWGVHGCFMHIDKDQFLSQF